MEPLFHKWRFYIEITLRILDRRYGNYLHFITSGSVLDQPWRTQQIVDFIRDLYIEKIQDEQERSMARSK